MKGRYSSQVTSNFAIQNGSMWTLCCGDSSLRWLFSESGVPIRKSPAGVGVLSEVAVGPGRWGFRGGVAGAAVLEQHGDDLFFEIDSAEKRGDDQNGRE